MDEEFIRLKVTGRLRHAELYEAAKRCGSQKALAELLGVQQSTVGNWINLQSRPSNALMVDRTFAEVVYRVTGKTPEELFPEAVQSRDWLALDKKFEKDVQVEVKALLGHHAAELLSLPSPEEVLESKERVVAVQKILERLPFREREILSMRMGLGGNTPLTCEEIARVFKVTRERARQVARRAIQRIQSQVKMSPSLLREFGNVPNDDPLDVLRRAE